MEQLAFTVEVADRRFTVVAWTCLAFVATRRCVNGCLLPAARPPQNISLTDVVPRRRRGNVQLPQIASASRHIPPHGARPPCLTQLTPRVIAGLGDQSI